MPEAGLRLLRFSAGLKVILGFALLGAPAALLVAVALLAGVAAGRLDGRGR